jgi:hypothetical protein
MNARPYFNVFLPPTAKHFAESQKTLQSVIVSGRMPGLSGYESGDKIVASMMEFVFDGKGHILEAVFRAMNLDDRINGREERSLSVGDVVRVGDEWHACDTFGWKQIDEPTLREEQDIQYTIQI